MSISIKNTMCFHKLKLCLALLLAVVASNAMASPEVNGTRISWPGDDWYQVQTADGSQTLCNGGRFCDVNPGFYLVINHTTGERFNDIEVAVSEVTSIKVEGTRISWPIDGWYQVQTADGSQTLCNGGRYCDVSPGNYLVINHTTGERFNDIEVSSSDSTDIKVEGTRISWPDDGWYQVQTADGSQTLCNGGRFCDVSPGNYLVINHSTGERFNDIEVGGDADNLTTSVNFYITVPVYMPSDELQLELVWGDMNFKASWVGDELWSASADIPADTQNTLTVTFYDFNGGIELARYSQELIISSNATQSENITADQFDADQFDEDGDGVNNLDELVAGTSPIVDEDSLLEITDYHYLGRSNRMGVQHDFESFISDSRPFQDTFEPEPSYEGFPGDLFGDVDIDVNGNGTLIYGQYWPIDQIRYSGTRTVSGNSVHWEGGRGAYDGDYRHSVSFSNTVTVIDNNTREFVEEISGGNFGGYLFTWETSSNLTGTLIDGTSLCRPISGTFSATYRDTPLDVIEISIYKEIEDPYWRVVRVANSTETTEYFARELIFYKPRNISFDDVSPEHKYFKCDFVDF